jgi:hypothetical protein
LILIVNKISRVLNNKALGMLPYYATMISTGIMVITKFGQKIPEDEDLCTSLWGWDGWDVNGDYREIDVMESFTRSFHCNVYNNSACTYGGKMYLDTAVFDYSQWYVFACEWQPYSYTFYINNHYIGSFNAETDCVLDHWQNISKWRLWIVNWVGRTASGSFPKELVADYIRFYSLNLTNISNDFYDYVSNYDYGVWKTVQLGDTYSSDTTFNDNGKHTICSTNGFTLGAGFEIAIGTEFETIIYKP